MKKTPDKYIHYSKNIIMLGFGGMGKAVLPLLFRHLQIKPSQLIVFTKDVSEQDALIAKEYGIKLNQVMITEQNYATLIGKHLSQGDFLLNLSLGISCLRLIELCQEKDVLYLDTCTDPWDGLYKNPLVHTSKRSNYAVREPVVSLKGRSKSTAVITHGANPGIVSHFVKQALLELASDQQLSIKEPSSKKEWAELAQTLGIKSIHIAERDTQVTNAPKQPGEFVNTWSVDGFLDELMQPSEMGWGSHERHLPHDASPHTDGCQAAIYFNCPSAAVKVRTWTPTHGAGHAFMVTHSESISIADYLTISQHNAVVYRPSVCYAYSPCSDAIVSLNEFVGNELQPLEKQRLIFDEIQQGSDELGVLLMGDKTGAYWYGSQLSISEARKQAPLNSATSLQVVAGIISGMLWAIAHPNEGVVEPEDMDHDFILAIANDYLGQVGGHYTTWTPLKHRHQLFPQTIDNNDPWQFINIRV